MNIQRINTSTLAGLKKAEKLHATGKYQPPVIDPSYSDILVFIPREEKKN